MQKRRSTRVDKGDGIIRPNVLHALGAIAARFSDDRATVDAASLIRRYSALAAWPADAQLGLVILAWALGPGFSLAGFAKAVNRLVPNFALAAQAVGPGRVPVAIAIGEAIRVAFRNAAVAMRWNLNTEHLYWPDDLSKSAGSDILRG
jgi:hypothetical protein